MNVVGLRFFIIGDSHTTDAGGPGQTFRTFLLQMGATKVEINGKSGRSAISFVQESGVDSILLPALQDGYDVVVLWLGTNDALGRSMDLNRQAFLQLRQVIEANGAQAWHVGPPMFPKTLLAEVSTETANARAAQVVTIGEETFGPRFFDSRPSTKAVLTVAQGRSSGGVHFQTKGARVWATGIMDAVVSRGTASGRTVRMALGISAVIASALVPIVFLKLR